MAGILSELAPGAAVGQHGAQLLLVSIVEALKDQSLEPAASSALAEVRAHLRLCPFVWALHVCGLTWHVRSHGPCMCAWADVACSCCSRAPWRTVA